MSRWASRGGREVLGVGSIECVPEVCIFFPGWLPNGSVVLGKTLISQCSSLPQACKDGRVWFWGFAAPSGGERVKGAAVPSPPWGGA